MYVIWIRFFTLRKDKLIGRTSKEIIIRLLQQRDWPENSVK